MGISGVPIEVADKAIGSIQSIHTLGMVHLFIQCSKKETFCPETGKINFLYRCEPNLFCTIVLVPKKFWLLSFGEISGLVPGRKVSFFEHCILKGRPQFSSVIGTLDMGSFDGGGRLNPSYTWRPSVLLRIFKSENESNGTWYRVKLPITLGLFQPVIALTLYF